MEKPNGHIHLHEDAYGKDALDDTDDMSMSEATAITCEGAHSMKEKLISEQFDAHIDIIQNAIKTLLRFNPSTIKIDVALAASKNANQSLERAKKEAEMVLIQLTEAEQTIRSMQVFRMIQNMEKTLKEACRSAFLSKENHVVKHVKSKQEKLQLLE